MNGFASAVRACLLSVVLCAAAGCGGKSESVDPPVDAGNIRMGPSMTRPLLMTA